MKLRIPRPFKGAKIIAALAVGFLITMSLSAQEDRIDRQTLSTLEQVQISVDELQSITAVLDEEGAIQRVAQADLEVIRAQIARELVQAEPNLDRIESLLREGLELEVVLRMSNIRQELAMKNIVGERRWVVIKRFAREIVQRDINVADMLERVRTSRPDLIPTLRVMYMYAN